MLACAIAVVASTKVRGEFNLQSDNHGKPVYKKNGQAVDREATEVNTDGSPKPEGQRPGRHVILLAVR